MKTGNDSTKSYRALRVSGTHMAAFSPERCPNKSYAHSLQKITKQKGATLFTALMFLIMLTVLGVNVAQLSVSEERMAGNTRSRDLAFQAASAALKYVELNLAANDTLKANLPTNPGLTGNSQAGLPAGYRYIDVCLPNTAAYWNGTGAPDCNSTPGTQSFSWTSTTAASSKHTLQQVAEQPLFVLERLPNAADGSEIYRVTARGVGGDASAVVILQALLSFH